MSRTTQAITGAIIIVLGFVAYHSIYTVYAWEQALVLQFGRPITVVPDAGLHFKLPWQSVEDYEKRILDLDPPVQEVLLSDQKRINVDSFARFRIVDPLEFKKRAVTQAVFRQVFGGLLNSAVRSEVAKVSLADMLSEKRVSVMAKITDGLKAQAPDFGVEVVDVRIGRTDLPEATSQAVYNRMRSQRIATAAQLRAEGEELKARIQAEADRDRTVILAEAEKDAQFLRGDGDAARTQMLIDAYGQDPEFFDLYRSLEAMGALQGEGKTMVLSPDNEFFRYFWGEQGKDQRTAE